MILRRVIPILFLILIISGCTITSNVVREPESNIEVFFCPQDMCQDKLLGLIERAEDVKCAFYDLNLERVSTLLKDKNADVIVEDSTEIPGFITYPSKDLMHNKFCIFDGSVVFTGSMNPTENDNYYNNNNILIIKSKALSENYLSEFDELRKGTNGEGGTVRNPKIIIGSTLVENYFCPEDNCKLRVINALKSANKSIRFMVFTFADKDIANLLYNKNYLGLDVKGVIEKRQSGQSSQYETLRGFTILDDNPHTMHHKVFIVDNAIVITGSYNPTARGNEGNDENLLIIHDENIARKYLEEFEEVYDQEQKMPDESDNLMLSVVNNNPLGKDEGNEFLELENIGPEDQDLDYYSVSDNKSTMRLSGVLKSGKNIRITPKFALKNKEGILLLRHNDRIIDYVIWGPSWNLIPREGEILVRTKRSIEQDSWSILKGEV